MDALLFPLDFFLSLKSTIQSLELGNNPSHRQQCKLESI